MCHSLASESAAKRLEIPALVEVNLSSEPTKSGIPEAELEDFLELYANVIGLMTIWVMNSIGTSRMYRGAGAPGGKHTCRR